MRMIALLLVVLGFVCCHTESPVFTPEPGSYPCHRQDGSADPNAVSCRPFDGSKTCCPSENRCVPDGCEATGYDERFGAARVTARRLERP